MKVSNNLAWAALILYTIGLFVPYIKFDLRLDNHFLDNLSVVDTIALFSFTRTILLVLVLMVPLVTLFFILRKRLSRFLTVVTVITFIVALAYLIFCFRDAKGFLIGVYLHLCSMVLFFIAGIIKFLVAGGKKSNSYLPKTEIELESWMKENCYHFNSYSINGNSIYEGFGIKKSNDLFIWYYTERGQENNIKTFQSENEIVEFAFNQIKADKWARTHCIGFTNDKNKNLEMKRALQKMKIDFFEDEIPYDGIDGPVYRIFVSGCDIIQTRNILNNQTQLNEQESANEKDY